MKASQLIKILNKIIKEEGDYHLQLNGKFVHFEPYIETLSLSANVKDNKPVIELGEK